MRRPEARRRDRLRTVLRAVSFSALLLLATGPGGAARAAPDPYPYSTDAPNPMKAPGLRSSSRLPLGIHPRTGYGVLLQRPVEGASQPLFLGLLSFYRHVISPVNGNQSGVAPVHSLYAVQAIQTHGVLLGTLLTTERLMHEPSELPVTPRFVEGGRVFHYDPLLHNTYWLWDWLK
jgi:hypothetical protein